MFYKYDIHVHSKEGSPCGKDSARDIARAYSNSGYAGFALTDHFYREHIMSDGCYKNGVMRNYNAYLEAKNEGEKAGTDVFFGIEFRFEKDDFLTFGIDLDFLLANEDIFDISFEEYADRVHEAGGFIIQAHPFRYIKKPIVVRVPHVDAIEIYNGSHTDNGTSHYRGYFNDIAEVFAKNMGIIGTAGSDTHDVKKDTCEPFRKASMLFDEKISDEKHLIELIKRNEFSIYKY